MTSSVRLRVFLLFSAGYFVSYVFRGVNLGFAPFITHDLGLSATDLGLLTSLYFLGFAGAQIPAGVLLDHFGSPPPPPRRPCFSPRGALRFRWGGARHRGKDGGAAADRHWRVGVSRRRVQVAGATLPRAASAARQRPHDGG